MSLPGRLVAGLLPRRVRFSSTPVHVGFVVDKVELGQVFPRSASVSSCRYHFNQRSVFGNLLPTPYDQHRPSVTHLQGQCVQSVFRHFPQTVSVQCLSRPKSAHNFSHVMYGRPIVSDVPEGRKLMFGDILSVPGVSQWALFEGPQHPPGSDVWCLLQ